MANITTPVGTRTALTTTALNSLASATYVSAGTLDLAAISPSNPTDLVVEVTVTPGTVSSKKQVAVFARVNLDGTNWSTGPVSGTTVTGEPNLYRIGTVPCLTDSTLQRKSFSLKQAIGFVPKGLEIVIKNETGAALAASGHAVHYSTIIGVIA